MTELEELLLHSKPVKILIQLNNSATGNYPSQIAREVDCTYSHAVRTIQQLEDYGLVKSKKNGRKKVVTLTSSGQEIADTFSQLFYLFRQHKRERE